MAQRTIVQLIDDLDGTAAEDISRIEFGADGVTYEIDLNEDNAAKLRDALAPFAAAARRIGGRSKRGPSSRGANAGRSKDETRAIREWAKANGHEISDRGRIPSGIIEAYETAGTA
ncbi:Lsr2 family protein [Allokutzneria sp. A3M-2-11 16]|uniref:histone-like nucleoid-structuring protein Lsr2 n=1 Tax=Allokutzneria sp. A3M-2-11 16 TaxID=2962043 RepID=UPI0020B781BC|nr:Lsr2 family protein [Allokutzneria sp. A3M-2-11 16]MCP3803229.1 Lsr2 family protein [Allokutzneria sp. A3M-2-11 16]